MTCSSSSLYGQPFRFASGGIRTQVVGKIRLALTPLINHWWNVPLHVSARGKWDSQVTGKERGSNSPYNPLMLQGGC